MSNLPESTTILKLINDRDQAIIKAIDSLARYKGAMFGYWFGIYVHLNELLRGTDHHKTESPFKPFITLARKIRDE